MIVFFCIAMIVSGVFFLFSVRRFDLFSLSYLGALIYFLPGFFGYVNYPMHFGFYRAPIVPLTYWIYILVVVGITVGAIVSDYYGRNAPPARVRPWAGEEWALPVLLWLMIAGIAWLFEEAGKEVFNPDKVEAILFFGRGYVLFSTSLMVLAPTAILSRKPLYIAAAALGMCFDLYMGYRLTAAISFVAAMTLYLNQKQPMSVALRYWSQGLIASLVVIVFMMYKLVIFAIRIGNRDLLLRIVNSPNFATDAIMQSEPFTIQGILNKIVETGFTVPFDHFSNLLYNVTVGADLFGADIHGFEDYYHPVLFPRVRFGMSSNIWGEMFASGGMLTLVAFILLFVLVTYALNRGMRRAPRLGMAMFANAGALWCFYIHRNNAVYQTSLMRRCFMVTAAVMILMAVLDSVAREMRQRRQAAPRLDGAP